MPAQPSYPSLFFGFTLPTSILRRVIFIRRMLSCLDWVNWKGGGPSVAAPSPSPEIVSKLSVRASARDLLFRDHNNFTVGEIHFHLPRWDVILQGHNKQDEILSSLKISVDVHDFFLPFKGDFQGTYNDSAFPPSIKFLNRKSCAGFEDFIDKTILEQLANGSLSIWGKVGFVSPPHLVIPLTVEPTKPRLCLCFVLIFGSGTSPSIWITFAIFPAMWLTTTSSLPWMTKVGTTM